MSFRFTDPKPNNEPPFTFTGPADIEEQLQAITDLAHDILRLVADVRRQISA
ncbi:hypothetical protein [Streptomyces sp. NBC_00239]|uniref:hypothetical protein n=1 Tax=Streptomyces sp. NBC_00239 TaxID=2903640 RepID=UPI002E2A286C|nr:hypothetical protein [Streptomyces sp. NBC_00239]